MSTNTPIASQTLGSAASSVTFSSIPQGYTDLVIVCNAAASAAANYELTFNSDAGTNYSRTAVAGNGSTAASYRETSANFIRCDQGGNLETTFGNPLFVSVMNYSNATTYKTTLSRSGGGSSGGGTGAVVGLWRSTAAITSLNFACSGASFSTGSTFSIYGIQVGQAAQKAQGGNIVTTDGTYVYHTFTSSGSFIPSQGLTADYLVVAGGGGGNSVANSGGGGAGGLRCTVGATGGVGSLESALSLTAKSYPVIVGAGGARDISGYNSGSNSVFATITSTGGGGGGAGLNGTYGVGTGNNGGSGGGAGCPVDSSVTNSGGTGTTNQGYAGGTSTRGANAYGGAGGGGAGAVGSNGSGASGGAGGNGVTTSISGTSTTYAGGGGGGHNESSSVAGGTGGGGTGGRNGASAGAGTPNTGGGGGGGGNANTVNNGIGANGGSGVVIIRYLL